ncbi:MAG: Na/Pi cotransporter family protein [Clostridiales bacterium]|nr:Na/Pi cotransporter family protein [Clostridiales bacterium]
MNSTLQIIFGLFGGLAIFIFGMNMMSDCLQKAAGEKMKSILAILTKNRILGVIAGALVTAVLQSSSATTVMTIGFVSAGLMTLPQAIPIILGANIGTTMTAQIIAFKITDYIYVFVFAGFIIAFLTKNEKIRNIGQTIFAFGLLFLGIETMGDVMKPLASSPVFTNLIGQVANIPILGVAVGTLMTLVVQSSSATIAVLQNFASQAGPDGVTSILGLAGAIPILLGDNIGTTITALLASIGQSRDAKRTAVAHTVFNVSGAVIFIWFVKPFAKLIQYISPKGAEVDVISRQIANAHTIFNITMTVVWVCLLGLLVKIVMKIVPEGKEGEIDLSTPVYLDKNVIHQPAAALRLVAQEVLRCSDMVKTMLRDVTGMIRDDNTHALKNVRKYGTAVRVVDGEINDYIAELFSSGSLTEQQATQTARLLCVLSDITRMGNLAADMADSIEEKAEKKYTFSEEAHREIKDGMERITGMYEDSIAAMTRGEFGSLANILRDNEDILNLDVNMRQSHMQRVQDGRCKKELTAPFTQILNCIDRMGNNCVNLAEGAMDQMSFGYFIGEARE